MFSSMISNDVAGRRGRACCSRSRRDSERVRLSPRASAENAGSSRWASLAVSAAAPSGAGGACGCSEATPREKRTLPPTTGSTTLCRTLSDASNRPTHAARPSC